MSDSQQDKCTRLEKVCSSLAGTPYVWGGEDETGADCSGFVHLVSKYMGQPVPRTTAKRLWLSTKAESVTWQKAKCGYLTWWTFTKDRPYGHIGIMTDPPEFWQSGRSKGVYSRKFFKGSFWDKHFTGSKRFFN